MRKIHNLIRLETRLRSPFTPKVNSGGARTASLSINAGDDRHFVFADLYDWQVAELAQSCLRYLDQQVESAKRLAERGRTP